MKMLLKKTKLLLPLVLLFTVSSIPAFASPGYLGIVVQNLSPPMKTALGIKNGILITRVLENSPASKAGLKAGDIITRINSKTTKDISDLLFTLEKETKGQIALMIITRGKKRKVLITPGPPDSTRFKWHYRLDRYGDSFNDPFFKDFKTDELKKLKKDMKELEKKLERLYKELGKNYDH